jgi:hypothetical protein
MSRRVTATYAEESTVARFTIGGQATVHELKRRACSELAKTAQRDYGFHNGFPSCNMASIVLSSGTTLIFFHGPLTRFIGSHGQLEFEPSTPVLSLCGADEIIVATIFAPPEDGNVAAPNPLSSALARPIHGHLNSLLQSHIDVITAELLQRCEGMMKVEREKREAALKGGEGGAGIGEGCCR